MSTNSKEKPKEEEAKALVIALKTPVKVPGATLAKGGKFTIDLKTAKHKEKSGEIAIEKII